MIQATVQRNLMPRPERGYTKQSLARAGYSERIVGDRICGWMRSPKSPEAVVCSFHGKGENAKEWISNLDFVVDEFNAALKLMEYRGYADPNEPLARSQDELVGDAVSIVEQFAVDPVLDGLPVVLWGRSLGGAITAATAAQVAVDGLILESTFSSFARLASEFIPVRFPALLLSGVVHRFALNTAKTLEELKCPVLIAYSDDDELIHISHAHRNFKAAKDPKQFVLVGGGLNDDKHEQQVFREALDEFAEVVAANVAESTRS